MRPRVAIATVFLLLVLGATAAPAFARQRVVLLAIEGTGGDAARDAVEEVLARQVAVLSEGLFRRRQHRLGIAALTDETYAKIATDLAADAIVTGTLRAAGVRARLSLTVRDARTGAITAVVVVVVPRAAIDRAGKDAIAAKLLPAVAAIAEAPDAAPEPADGPATDAAHTDDAHADATHADDTASSDDAAHADATDTTTADASGADAAATDTSTTDTTAPAEAASTDDSESEPESEGGLGPLSGKTFAYVRAPVDGGPFQQVSSSLWLSAKPRISDTVSARLEVALDGVATSQTETARVRLNLREAFVAMRKRGWLVRAGQQIIPWGSSDVVNPTDFLTARDYRLFVVDAEQSRTGALSVMVSHASRHLEATLVATPVFAASTILVPADALPAGVTLDPAATPSAAVLDTEVAAKLKLSGEGWDLGLVGFRGWNHTPEFELVSATATSVVMRQTHHRILAAGLDGSASAGKLVFRVEGAFVLTDNRDGTDPTIQPSYAFGVVGVERPLGDRVRIQAQVIARAYPSWTAPADATGTDPATTAGRQAVAAANALLLDYQDQQRPAATLRIAYTSEDERIEAEIFAAMNLVGNDYLIRPLIGWHPAEAVSIQVGLDGYGGPIDRPLGALHPFGGAFAQVAYTF
ncbi:MAG: hypothetical protein K8W52_05315 [Deltaproteobacteria bacterium]|nr:hypothetical protein [Deltaproteobacteria bacterium]